MTLALTIALIVLLCLVTLWWALRFLPAGADGHGPLPYLIAFVRFLWIPSLIILLVALASRHWAIAVAAAILAGLIGLFASPWYRKWCNNKGTKHDERPSTTTADTTTVEATDITVMTLNCRYGHASADAIVEAVRAHNVSVLALQELTTGLVERLEAAGLATLLPNRQLGVSRKGDNGGFNGVWSREAFAAQTSSAIDIQAADVPGVVVRDIAFYSAHPKSPMRGCREWSHGIRKLGELANQNGLAAEPVSSMTSNTKTERDRDASMSMQERTGTATIEPNVPTAAVAKAMPSSVPTRATVIMGDLNSNADHPSFRSLLKSGLNDAGLAVSHESASSFPTWLRWPRLELDHVLTTPAITATQARILAIPGSDHFALLANLKVR
ncbi:endonuclease/exonuclease/phosphatase family protein [Bifidobacterium sp. ESL0790]|uniref:endonuclease/exonuclease/phosphatase family protein n=1 Tax=Bifidobacterium sp. ESL0790 TaxID=2983233 RepID=UPI0023F96094|nr:endonuclease/exonuclease/phosphatase family protein [Bifidobacterium sp. ESL0790]WEV72655.1 endonuclease/exonuclease/phosphatase family protein [Bifidobacterium sp. ESL0790]